MPATAPAPPAPAARPAAPPAGRHFGMDWLRIGAFQLLILYHIGMVFVPWEWHVSTDVPVNWAVLPMVAINAWRLTLLFAVSGYASAAMLDRKPDLAAFARGRVVRLGLPLLFGIIVITPIQPWIQLTTQRGYTHDFGYFYLHDYWRFAMYRRMPLPAWQHLWFVFYLLAYTLILACLRLLPATLRAAGRWVAEHALAGPLLLLVPAALAVFVRIHWLPHAEDNHNFLGDWVAHVRHLPGFLFGYLLYGSASLWKSVRRHWRWIGLLGIAATIAAVLITNAYPASRPITRGMRDVYQAVRVVQGWASILGLLGLADRYWAHDGRWRTMLAEAVFPFYLIHQTIIILVGWLMLGSGLPNWLQLLALVAATITGCWAFYLGGRRIGWLRPLIGLRPMAKREIAA